MAAWPEEALVGWFISGLYDGEVRRHCQMHQYDEKTIEAVRDYAITLTGMQKVADAMDKRRSNKPFAASQAACAPSNRRNNQAQVSAATTAANSPQVSAASGGAPKQQQHQFKDSPEEHAKWVARKEKARAWMKENSFRGCPACAGFHRLKKSYKGCRSVCPICEMEFKDGKSRHWWVECRKLKDLKEREKILERFRAVKHLWKKEQE